MTEKPRQGDNSSVPPLSEESFEPGLVVGGKYKVIALLGAGGMGSVYQVEQVFLSKQFALKSLHIRMMSDVSVRRFQIEARAASLLNHPNLVQVTDFGILETGQPYLAMDLVTGSTLAQFIRQHGTLSTEQVKRLIPQVCFGLAYAHEQGVVHRDIKPSNIMIVDGAAFGSEGSVKVLDFGIAKITGTEIGEVQALTRTGEIFGSPLYMSPEQSSGTLVDHRSDIYSLGCVLFEALTGTPPYLGQNALKTMLMHQSESPPSLREAALGKPFPADLERIVAKMLSKSPDDRYQNLGVVAHEIAAVGNSPAAGSRVSTRSATSVARPASLKSAAPKPVKNVSIAPNQLYILVAATAILSGLGGYFFTHSAPHSESETGQHSDRASITNTASASQKEKDDGFVPNIADTLYQDLNGSGERLKLEKEIFDKSGMITPVEVAGGKLTEFVFPKFSVGNLVEYDNVQRLRFITLAKGVVQVPAGRYFALEVTGETEGVLRNPSIIGKMNAMEFTGLVLSPDLEDANDLGKNNAEDWGPTRRVADVLRAAAKWPNLQTICLHNVSENEKLLDPLDNLEHLRNFSYNGATVNPDHVAPHAFLDKLEVLSLCDLQGPSFDPILQRLAVAKKLRVLILENILFSADALRRLHQCEKLEYLQLRLQENEIDLPLIKAICELKSLRTLYFKDAAPTFADVKILTRCSWLKTIILPGAAYSSTTIAGMRALDNRISFKD